MKNYVMSPLVVVHGQQSQDGRRLSTGGLCGFCGNKALNCHISWVHYHILGGKKKKMVNAMEIHWMSTTQKFSNCSWVKANGYNFLGLTGNTANGLAFCWHDNSDLYLKTLTRLGWKIQYRHQGELSTVCVCCCIKILQIGILLECTLEGPYTRNSAFCLQLSLVNKDKVSKKKCKLHWRLHMK